MTLKDVVDAFELTVYCDEGGLDRPVTGGYVSDLLSDVMGFAREGELWITLQAHRNITGIASLKDLPGIILVKGIAPDQDALAIAKNEGVVILGTKMGTFEMAGKLYEFLNRK